MYMKTKYIFPHTEVQMFESANLMALMDPSLEHANPAPARGVQHSDLGGSLGPSY